MSETLLTSLVEEDRGNGLKSVNLSGEPHAAAIVNAVAGNYGRFREGYRPDEDVLRALVHEKVTIVIETGGAFGHRAIVGIEGRLFEGTGGRLAILPKGKRKGGPVIDPAKVLELFSGWVVEEARELVTELAGRFPALEPLTEDRLRELPARLPSNGPCSLALFGTHPLWGGTDCVWLLNAYAPGDDIAEGVLLVRPEFAKSEFGSVYGRELLKMPLGVVSGFEPLDLRTADRLTDVDHDEGLRVAFGSRAVAA